MMNLGDEDVSVNDPFINLLCFDNNDEDEVDLNSVEDSSDVKKIMTRMLRMIKIMRMKINKAFGSTCSPLTTRTQEQTHQTMAQNDQSSLRIDEDVISVDTKSKSLKHEVSNPSIYLKSLTYITPASHWFKEHADEAKKRETEKLLFAAQKAKLANDVSEWKKIKAEKKKNLEALLKAILDQQFYVKYANISLERKINKPPSKWS
ncbi:hypothetical protein R6Q59_018938 [Mikania micrantha]